MKMSLGHNVAIQVSFGDSVHGPPKLPIAAKIAVLLITAADDDVWGLRCSRRNAAGREGKGVVAREGLPRRMQHYPSPSKLRGASAPGVALRASSPHHPPRAIRDAWSVRSPRLLPLAPPKPLSLILSETGTSTGPAT